MNVARITINLRAKFHKPTSCGSLVVAMKTRAKRKYSRRHRIVIYTLRSYYPKKLNIFHRSITIQRLKTSAPASQVRGPSMLSVIVVNYQIRGICTVR